VVATQTNQRVAVVGGGMLGMTLALRLRQQGRDVVLFEGREQLGGLADSWHVGDVQWDRHYHVTLLSDSHLRGLLQELNLDDRMRWVKTKTGFFTDGRLYSMSNSIEFLKFPPLGLIDKFRLAATITLTSRNKNWKKLESELVFDYLTRLSGKRTANKIWLPLLKAKLGDNYRETSAAFIWATIGRLYAARRSGLKEEMFGYMEGGYATTLKTLGDKLVDEGVDVRLGQRVEKIEPVATGGIRITANGEEALFDKCVMTIPSAVIPQLCPALPDQVKALHHGIKYQGIICASVLLSRKLSDFYVTNITDEVPFTGVIEMSALVPSEELGGKHLIYLPKYVLTDSEELGQSDEQIEVKFMAGLRKLYPDLRDDEVLAFKVSRAKYVMPIPTIRYSESLPPRKSALPGIYVANGAQLVNATLNVNEIVKLAEAAAEEMAKDFASAEQPNTQTNTQPVASIE